MQNLHELSARQLAAAIRTRRISSEEATREAIDRLKQVHEVTHCTISLEADAAIADARAADAALQRDASHGPLMGVPLAHKDMFDRVDKIASWGARIRAATPATRDATVISRVKNAGAIQIAALHLTEFAFGPTGHNYVLGHARNPWDPARITGGSSSGTACAVAAGAIPAGFGSDTAGSLRVPAACCGVTSLKATWSRVSRAGAMPLAPSFDVVGPIARHVEDLALILGLIAGRDARDAATSHLPVPDYLAALNTPVRGVRVGVDETLMRDAHPEVQRMIADVVRILERTGAARVACAFPDWQMIDHLAQLLQFPEVSSQHDRFFRTRADDYGPQVRARLELGHFIRGVDHATAKRARGTVLRRTLEQAFGKCDVVILPVIADPVPTIAELDVGGGPRLTSALARIIGYTRPINYLGLPTITLPAPRGSGMPQGFQIVGKPFDEARLLAIGAAYQREVPPEIARRLA